MRAEPTATEPRAEEVAGARTADPEPTQRAEGKAPKRRPITIACDCD